MMVSQIFVVHLLSSLAVLATITEVRTQPEPVCLILDSLEVHKNFLSSQEVEHLSQADVNGQGMGGGVFHGKVLLSHEITSRHPQKVEGWESDLDSCRSAGNGAVSIRT
jgi:hypothetical protein